MEKYQGVKFKTHFISNEIPKYASSHALVKWCHVFSYSGFCPEVEGGSAGNLSVRTKNGCIISASHTDLSKMTINDLVEVVSYDEKKNEISARGIKEPSSETFLHVMIYERRNDINAIFHGHYLDLPNLPETPEEHPYGTLELAYAVAGLAESNDLILAKNHGFFSLGKTTDQAGNRILDAIKDKGDETHEP